MVSLFFLLVRLIMQGAGSGEVRNGQLDIDEVGLCLGFWRS